MRITNRLSLDLPSNIQLIVKVMNVIKVTTKFCTKIPLSNRVFLGKNCFGIDNGIVKDYSSIIKLKIESTTINYILKRNNCKFTLFSFKNGFEYEVKYG